MKLVPKLGLGFLILLLAIWLFGIFVIETSAGALRRALAEHAVAMNLESLDILERDVFRKINHFRNLLYTSETQEALFKSNLEFGAMKDANAYIDEKEKEWTSAGKRAITPFMADLIDNPLSNFLRLRMLRYEKMYGEKNPFAEAFITNEFGANVAQTGKTTDYRQNDEYWWQEAAKHGIVIEGMDFDESSEVTAMDVAIAIRDEEGHLSGVMKLVMNVRGLLYSVEELEAQESANRAERYMIDPEGNVKYADVLRDVRNVSDREFFKKIRGGKGYFMAPGYAHRGRSLFVYNLSADQQNFKNLGWYLVAEYPEGEIFKPVRKLRLRLLISLTFLSVMAIVIAFFLLKAITYPVDNLRNAVTEFGKGNFDYPIRVVTKDEIGQVTAAFRKLIIDLRRSTISVDSLNREIERRIKTEAQLKELNTRHLDSHRAVKNMLYDLTESHESLKKAQRQIIQSEKLAAIGQLAAGIAHEINNPVGFINSNLSSLRKYFRSLAQVLGAYEVLKVAAGRKEEENIAAALANVEKLSEGLNLKFIMTDAEELLQESQAGMDRVKKIIGDLKTFARSDTGGNVLEDVNKIIEGVLNIVWNELKYKVELVREYGAVPAVRCNPQEIGQTMINLLINAGQAIPDKGKIVIRTYAKGPEVFINITDNGSGISPENLEKIFDPFFTTKEPGKGTGLGLAICYDLIKRHGGRMEVYSDVGKGTTFTVVLPAASAAAGG